jgi:hypothetical protein
VFDFSDEIAFADGESLRDGASRSHWFTSGILFWWRIVSAERGVNNLRDYFGTFGGCSVDLVSLRSDFGFRVQVHTLS